MSARGVAMCTPGSGARCAPGGGALCARGSDDRWVTVDHEFSILDRCRGCLVRECVAGAILGRRSVAEGRFYHDIVSMILGD